MTAFFDLYSGGAVALDAIERIGRAVERQTSHGPEKRHRVYLKNGTDYPLEISRGSLNQLLERPVQLLPAEPGARLLEPNLDAEGFACSATTLIAWALCADGFIRPVTPAGVDDGGTVPTHGFWVEIPGGQICEVGPDAATAEDRADLERIVRQRSER